MASSLPKRLRGTAQIGRLGSTDLRPVAGSSRRHHLHALKCWARSLTLSACFSVFVENFKRAFIASLKLLEWPARRGQQTARSALFLFCNLLPLCHATDKFLTRVKSAPTSFILSILPWTCMDLQEVACIHVRVEYSQSTSIRRD